MSTVGYNSTNLPSFDRLSFDSKRSAHKYCKAFDS